MCNFPSIANFLAVGECLWESAIVPRKETRQSLPARAGGGRFPTEVEEPESERNSLGRFYRVKWERYSMERKQQTQR